MFLSVVFFVFPLGVSVVEAAFVGVGTNAIDWEWVLGPPDSNPGALPDNPRGLTPLRRD